MRTGLVYLKGNIHQLTLSLHLNHHRIARLQFHKRRPQTGEVDDFTVVYFVNDVTRKWTTVPGSGVGRESRDQDATKLSWRREQLSNLSCYVHPSNADSRNQALFRIG